MKYFWTDLKKPIFALAPMEDVTDAAFRSVIAQQGKPDVMFCEFTSADGLVLADEPGLSKLRRKLLYNEIERPVVAQFFTAIPQHMEKAAALAAELGFDGVDINMGCPDRAVERSGCGAAMIRAPKIAREIIQAAKRGWKIGKERMKDSTMIYHSIDNDRDLPVSVKTRLGYDTDELETWLPTLLSERPAAITIHARTRKEMSAVPAHWDRIRRAVEIRNESGSETLIIGNGDVTDVEDARLRAQETGADGVMLGRAIFGNPWLFARRDRRPTPEEKIQALIEHIERFDRLLGDVKSFAVMKKHFKAYINGWAGAKALRVRLMSASAAEDAIRVLQSER